MLSRRSDNFALWIGVICTDFWEALILLLVYASLRMFRIEATYDLAMVILLSSNILLLRCLLCSFGSLVLKVSIWFDLAREDKSKIPADYVRYSTMDMFGLFLAVPYSPIFLFSFFYGLYAACHQAYYGKLSPPGFWRKIASFILEHHVLPQLEERVQQTSVDKLPDIVSSSNKATIALEINELDNHSPFDVLEISRDDSNLSLEKLENDESHQSDSRAHAVVEIFRSICKGTMLLTVSFVFYSAILILAIIAAVGLLFSVPALMASALVFGVLIITLAVTGKHVIVLIILALEFGVALTKVSLFHSEIYFQLGLLIPLVILMDYIFVQELVKCTLVELKAQFEDNHRLVQLANIFHGIPTDVHEMLLASADYRCNQPNVPAHKDAWPVGRRYDFIVIRSVSCKTCARGHIHLLCAVEETPGEIEFFFGNSVLNSPN